MQEYRKEDKFIVDIRMKEYLRNKLIQHFDLVKEENYDVDSFYFNDRYTSFPIAEGTGRLRARFYNSSNEGHVEIKKKYLDRNKKVFLCPIKVDDLLSFEKSETSWKQSLLTSLSFNVSYKREAMEFKIKENDKLRVTFDSYIFSSRNEAEKIGLLSNYNYVVEFKYLRQEEELLNFYRNIIRRSPEKFSKYTTALRKYV